MDTKTEETKLVGSSDLFGLRPASELVPLYEARLLAAEAHYAFWRDEFAKHGDPISESAWNAASRIVGDVWAELRRLKQPGSCVRYTPNTTDLTRE